MSRPEGTHELLTQVSRYATVAATGLTKYRVEKIAEIANANANTQSRLVNVPTFSAVSKLSASSSTAGTPPACCNASSQSLRRLTHGAGILFTKKDTIWHAKAPQGALSKLRLTSRDVPAERAARVQTIGRYCANPAQARRARERRRQQAAKPKPEPKPPDDDEEFAIDYDPTPPPTPQTPPTPATPIVVPPPAPEPEPLDRLMTC